MTKLSVTLDRETYAALERHAKQVKKPCVKVAKEILMEGLAQRELAARRKKLAADYVARRTEARALHKDLEAPQLGLLDDEES